MLKNVIGVSPNAKMNAAGQYTDKPLAGDPDFKKDDKPHPGERDPSVRASREKPKKEPSKPKIVAPMDNPFDKMIDWGVLSSP